MMPSDCHIGWAESDFAVDTGTRSSVHSVTVTVPKLETHHANGTTQEHSKLYAQSEYGRVIKCCIERTKSSLTCKPLLASKTVECSAQSKRSCSESMCPCPACGKSFAGNIDELAVNSNNTLQSRSVIKSPWFEEEAESDISCINFVETQPESSSDTTCATVFSCEHCDALAECKRLRVSAHQNGASSHTHASKVTLLSEIASGEKGRSLQPPTVSGSALVRIDENKNVVSGNLWEAHNSDSATAVKLDSACSLLEQRKHLIPSRKSDSNTNANTGNIPSVNGDTESQSAATMNEHGQAAQDLSVSQHSDIGNDGPPVDCEQSNTGQEQHPVSGTSSSDLHGQAESLCVCSEGQTSGDIDSLPASELASVQSGLSLEVCSSRECVDVLPLLNAMNLGQNQSELSDTSCCNEEADSVPLVTVIQFDNQKQSGVCTEQSQDSSTSTDMTVDLDEVPDEILLKVFSYLKPAELCVHVTAVCKRWHCLAYDHSLWRRLDLSRIRVNGFQVCQIILRASGAIRRLDMSGIEHLSNAEMAVVAENCPDLTHLDVGFVDDLSSTMMHAVLTSCPRLEFLNMEGCRNANNEMMRVLVALAGSTLKQLNFSHCSLVDESLWLMMQHIHGLTHLNIDGISWISELVIQHLATEYCETLESWELDGNELTDSTIHSVAACHRLKILSISFCEQLTDQSIKYLKLLENLEKMSLRKGPSFSSAALTDFLSSPTLRNLTYLDLTECQQLEDEGVRSIAETFGTKLKTLCLSWCWDITDKGMEHIANTCKDMVNMYLVGLHRLEGLWLATAVETMPQLRYISFEQCNEVGDIVIEEAVRDKTDLVILNYYGELFMHTVSPQ